MIAAIIALATSFLLFLHLIGRRNVEEEFMDVVEPSKKLTNGASWYFTFWTSAIDQYGLPFGQYCISSLYALYRRFTFINLAIFLLKYIPTGFYLYKLIKSIYFTSRERIKQKQQELEDLQLQIQIVNTRLYVRDSEFTERADQLRRGAERLRAVRARVRGMIAADEELKRALDGQAPWDSEPELHVQQPSFEDEREFIIALPEWQAGKESGEHATTEPNSCEESLYSTLSDGDSKQICRVKMVKVTNVYKVAYLKHYIKQKRLRRASKQAVLRKKIEGIMKLLEDWQKTLSMVISNKLSMLDNPLEVASSEAMGDYSKPNLRESSDSDSDLRGSSSDLYFDEYNFSWPHKSYSYNYEDMPDNPAAREFYDSQDFNVKSQSYPMHPCECNGIREPNLLFILPEETSSQIAIEEIKSENGVEFEADYRDIVAL